MKENFQKFFEQLSVDLELREKFTKQSSIKEAYAVAAEAVPGFTMEEFTSAMAELRRLDEEKLTDKALEKVCGGMAQCGMAPYEIHIFHGTKNFESLPTEPDDDSHPRWCLHELS